MRFPSERRWLPLEKQINRVHNKLSSVQQLQRAVQQRHDDLDEALDETVGDENILTNLRDLGYLE